MYTEANKGERRFQQEIGALYEDAKSEGEMPYRAEGDGYSSEKSQSVCGHSHISSFFEWSASAR